MNTSAAYETGSSEPIDAVYTWVNSDDPLWRQQLRRTLKSQGQAQHTVDLAWQRYRSHDELRYSLRSLERYAPWIRTVYLVTSGQQPEWLKRDSPRLQLVSHEQIFPDAAGLPTFNSHAIELNLHRVQGLSRRFLYINDDLFFGRTCGVDDFMRSGVEIGYLGDIHFDRQVGESELADLACSKTRKSVETQLGPCALEWMPAHTPQLYDREGIAELERQFPEAFARTSTSLFRSPEDFVLRIAYSMLSKSLGKRQVLLKSGSDEYSFVRLHGSFVARLRDFRHIRKNRPRFFCLNDDMVPGWQGRAIDVAMRRLLERCFPEPSGFETGAGQH